MPKKTKMPPLTAGGQGKLLSNPPATSRFDLKSAAGGKAGGAAKGAPRLKPKFLPGKAGGPRG
ncbi:hypothetical protein OU426_09790 [Frigidibacter sp. RF13]|uniref:hypothetical protein n=1 Tax=Frigidibacter sp. RF13 TaxID=2997340 RepID=UPI00226FCF55|nr:hypothetical protein [Frigidibacter sp. RF13]MCY1127143.1 hypothetical protein [Frigidibacter sp. RF13]